LRRLKWERRWRPSPILLESRPPPAHRPSPSAQTPGSPEASLRIASSLQANTIMSIEYRGFVEASRAGLLAHPVAATLAAYGTSGGNVSSNIGKRCSSY